MKKLWKSLVLIVPVVLLFVAIVFSNVPIKREDKSSENLKDSSDSQGIVWAGAINTGASSASRDYKGGAIFLEPNTSYTMSGGTISGKKKTYGGAVFISSGATFTMTGGTIKNCSASYGGGIYVCAGATCNITAGTITGCSASEAGPAIYIEDGGTLNLWLGADVSDDEIQDYNSVKVEIVGKDKVGGTRMGTASTLSLDYVYFGSYPQTYVGDTMNTILENWYGDQPIVKTYTIRDRVWNAYQYVDGEIYVRGLSNPRSTTTNVTYKDGTVIKRLGTACWFKVEPIKWFVINNSGDKYELFSEIVLTGNIFFNSAEENGNSWETSYIRDFCNDEFYNTAFNGIERKIINLSHVGNNVTGNYSYATSDSSGTVTDDYIYLKSYYELGTTPFRSDLSQCRISSASDFAFSNFADFSTTSYYTSFYRGDKTGNVDYWLRSAGSLASDACLIDSGGGRIVGHTVIYRFYGVRPALVVSVE